MEKRPLTWKEFQERFDDAIQYRHIFPYYQAQVNHSTGQLVGAEALMRWEDPECGMQSPADFIPILEETGLIFRADLYMFEEVCSFLKKCIIKNIPLVPISVNMSRFDVLDGDLYVDEIESVRRDYNVPVDLIRIEITESFAIHGVSAISPILKKLHDYGYIVEMDDFGSGYSSLNILKDLNVDIIKLDMSFLKGDIGGRGGAILGSIMLMTKWLNTPTIAEGVETVEQADYMRSIGCCNVQGYLYSKPIQETAFLDMLTASEHEKQRPTATIFEDIDTGKFWDPASIESLLFNTFIGPAAIFTYEGGKAEVLRVNSKYVKELGVDLDESVLLTFSPWKLLDEDGHILYEKTLNKAIHTSQEEECENWRTYRSMDGKEKRICIRSFLRMIGKADEQYLFFVSIRNVTAEKSVKSVSV